MKVYVFGHEYRTPSRTKWPFLTFSRLFNGMKKSYLTIYSMAYALLWHKLGNSFPLGVKL